jgi:hypothetical protein
MRSLNRSAGFFGGGGEVGVEAGLPSPLYPQIYRSWFHLNLIFIWVLIRYLKNLK